jgi:serine/threonine protein kinase
MFNNQRDLINKITKTESLLNRYTNLQCVNVCVSGGEKRGHFSLIFKALDIVENKSVILKFMDPNHLGNDYRLRAFKREPEILRRLRSKKRCLQLVDDEKNFDWELFPNPNDPTALVKLPIGYFVTEYLPNDIDNYFNNQNEVVATSKLEIFKKILLSIEAIHSENIHHRDLKPDNMRSNSEASDGIVVAIDYGTAAHLEIEQLSPDYHSQVGHASYSAPETFCGLAGLREIGHLTDIYALGVMLFELFNREFFVVERNKNPHYSHSLLALRSLLLPVKDIKKREAEWKNQITIFQHVVEPPAIDQPGHSIPSAIVEILKGIHSFTNDSI